MKHIKIYIVTYKRSDVLNDTLDKLFKSDFADIKNTDVVSEAKAQLKKLAATIQANKASITDAATVNHLSDLQDRIKEILDPK